MTPVLPRAKEQSSAFRLSNVQESVELLTTQHHNMEAAGVVLGAIPIVITALKCYKDTIRLGGRLFKRKKHIEKLIRTLNEQKGALEQNLEWLSKAIGEPCDRIEELDLEDELVRETMIEYLGSSGSRSFALALKDAQKTVSSIIRNIKGLLPDKIVRMTPPLSKCSMSSAILI